MQVQVIQYVNVAAANDQAWEPQRSLARRALRLVGRLILGVLSFSFWFFVIVIAGFFWGVFSRMGKR